MCDGTEAHVQGTLETLPQDAEMGPRSKVPKVESQNLPLGLCTDSSSQYLWAWGVAPSLLPLPTPLKAPHPPLFWVWLSAPPAQALTWTWGCWFSGEAGRLGGSPNISIQGLLSPAC